MTDKKNTLIEKYLYLIDIFIKKCNVQDKDDLFSDLQLKFIDIISTIDTSYDDNQIIQYINNKLYYNYIDYCRYHNRKRKINTINVEDITWVGARTEPSVGLELVDFFTFVLRNWDPFVAPSFSQKLRIKIYIDFVTTNLPLPKYLKKIPNDFHRAEVEQLINFIEKLKLSYI